MYELDKKEFGAFLAELRKQKKMTQKELAQQLFVSDKAVSKWERGLNMPDITLLIPLAQALGVSVTELLEGRRMPSNEPMNATQVEALVKKAITMTEEDSQVLKQRRKTYCRLLIGCLILTAAEFWILIKSGYGQLVSVSNIAVMELLSIIFGWESRKSFRLTTMKIQSAPTATAFSESIWPAFISTTATGRI